MSATRIDRFYGEAARSVYASVAVVQLPQHVVQDAAVAVVEPLVRRVDPHGRLELVVARLDRDGLGALLEIGDAVLLTAVEPERVGRLAVRELQRQDAHA